MHNKTRLLFAICFSLAFTGCGPQKAKPAAIAGACSLLSDTDIQEVQGEAVAERTSNETSSGKLVTSQCFYRLPTFSRSVNLEVTRAKDPAESARSVEEFWERRFGVDQERKNDAEETDATQKSGDVASRQSEEREEETRARPQPVPGIGDEAFWTANQINGSLYFRKNGTIVRVSIGGPDDQPTKINKAKTLAENILNNL